MYSDISPHVSHAVSLIPPASITGAFFLATSQTAIAPEALHATPPLLPIQTRHGSLTDKQLMQTPQAWVQTAPAAR
jgi:hypothetical protein